MSLKLPPEVLNLLQNLAAEDHRTAEDLIAKWVKDEHEARHLQYNPQTGEYDNVRCPRPGCFVDGPEKQPRSVYGE
jgi:hypothetical protein